MTSHNSSLQLLLIRHGETLGNVDKIYYGNMDIPLNDTGIIQANELGIKLKHLKPVALYTSPLKRAYQTAYSIAKHHPSLKLCNTDNLKEMDFGLWEGLTYQQVMEQFPNEWENWCNDWWNTVVPQGESAASMHKRVISYIDNIISKHKKGCVIIVSHHGCIRSIISHLLGCEAEGYWRFKVEPGSIVKLDIVDGYAVLSL